MKCFRHNSGHTVKYDPRNTFKTIAIRWYTGDTRLCPSIGKENFYEDDSVLPW